MSSYRLADLTILLKVLDLHVFWKSHIAEHTCLQNVLISMTITPV